MTRTRRTMLSALMLMLTLILTGLPASAQSPVRIRIGTAAPDGSIWDEVIEQMANDWRRIAGDRLHRGGQGMGSIRSAPARLRGSR
jgi:TRAP-type C4-dicarboxylate transport system substrate-binding protein